MRKREKEKKEKRRKKKRKKKKKRAVKKGEYWQPAGETCRLLLCTGWWKVVGSGTKRWSAAWSVLTGQAGIKDICCRQSPKCFEHPWAQTAREAISKTQFYKPGPGVLAPGGVRGSVPWYWQYPSISAAPKYAGFFHGP